MTTQPLLELQHVDTYYGPVQVHFDLNIRVLHGEIVCLLGGNASGKSTTMKLILGLVKPRAGHVFFNGVEISGMATPHIIRLGMGSVPEARRIFSNMTVRENLLMGGGGSGGAFSEIGGGGRFCSGGGTTAVTGRP